MINVYTRRLAYEGENSTCSGVDSGGVGLGGTRWVEEENKILRELIEQGLGAQQIYASGKLPGRTYEAIRKQVNIEALIAAKTSTKVEAIEPAADALTMEKLVKLYSTAYDQICSTQQVDKLAMERLRIIFQAAKDYAGLLAGYEKWDKIEKRVDELTAAVAQLQAAKSAAKA